MAGCLHQEGRPGPAKAPDLVRLVIVDRKPVPLVALHIVDVARTGSSGLPRALDRGLEEIREQGDCGIHLPCSGQHTGLNLPNAARIIASGVATGRTGSSLPPSSVGGLKAWPGQSDGFAGPSRGLRSFLPAPLTLPATSLGFGAGIAVVPDLLGTSSIRFRPVHPSCSIAQPFRPTGQNVWTSVSETCPAIVLSRRTRQHDRPSEPVVRSSRLALPEDGPCGLVHVSTAPATSLSSARTRASSALHSGDRRCSSMEGPSSFRRAETAITGNVTGAVATAATFEQPASAVTPTTSIATPDVVSVIVPSFMPSSESWPVRPMVHRHHASLKESLDP